MDILSMNIETVLVYLLFIPGFYLLIKGADLLIEGSISIARKFKIPDIVVGLTIISIGTSLPELAVNINASIKGQSDIAISNVLGSNVANILLILGISAMIRELTVKENTIWKEIPFSFLGSLVILFLANDMFFNKDAKNILESNEGVIILFFFLIFLYYIYSISKNEQVFEEEIPKKQLTVLRAFIYIIIGLIFLPIGSDWVVNGAVEIARLFRLSEAFIGLTIVATGTSLPELAASSVSAYKGNSDIAIGNVVGSNIFNIFWVLGLSATIKPLHFSTENNIDVFVTVFASFLLFLFLFIGKRHILERSQGILFLVFYISYIIFRAYFGYKG